MKTQIGSRQQQHRKLLFGLTILAVVLFACNMPGQATEEPATPTEQETVPPTEEPVPTVSPTEFVPTETEIEIPANTYTIAVIVDLSSEPVTRAQAQAVIDEASAIFEELTGFTLMMIDFVEMMPTARRSELPESYLASIPVVIPNAIVMFSYGDNDTARLYGGFSGFTQGPARYSSRFPINGNDSLINVSTVHFGHRYAICGYDPDNRDELISDVSVGGECRNRPGTPCVEKFGYSMCSTSVDDLYASTPTYMVSSSIVHEIAHPYGRHGNYDHWGAPECLDEMGWTSSTYPSSLDDSQPYVNMCPYVFDLIIESYQPE